MRVFADINTIEHVVETVVLAMSMHDVAGVAILAIETKKRVIIKKKNIWMTFFLMLFV